MQNTTREYILTIYWFPLSLGIQWKLMFVHSTTRHCDISVKKSSLRRILSATIEGHIFLLATKIESQYTKAKLTISLFSVTMRFFPNQQHGNCVPSWKALNFTDSKLPQKVHDLLSSYPVVTMSPFTYALFPSFFALLRAMPVLFSKIFTDRVRDKHR